MNPEIELIKYKNEQYQLKMFLKVFILVTIILFTCFIFSCRAKTAEAKDMDLTKAVIHHTAGNKATDRDLTVEEIDRYHKSKGWDGIGYHFLIRKDGVVYEGRPLTKHGAHAKGRNYYIGIALTGYDEFTSAQLESLRCLLIQLGIKHIESHHENCPGKGINLKEVSDV